MGCLHPGVFQFWGSYTAFGSGVSTEIATLKLVETFPAGYTAFGSGVSTEITLTFWSSIWIS